MKKFRPVPEPNTWKQPAQFAGLLFILLLCGLPLFITRRGYATITGDKFGFMLGATALCAAGILWSLIRWAHPSRWGRALCPPRRPGALLWADIFALAFFAAAVLSTVLAADPAGALLGGYQRNDGLLAQGAYLLVYLILSRFYRPKGWHMAAVCAAVGIVCLYGVAQSLNADPLALFDFKGYLPASGVPYTPYTMPFRSTIGNINLLSAYGAVAAALLGLGYGAKGGGVLLAGGCFGFYTLLLSRSDSGVVGLLVAMLVSLPWIMKAWHRLKRLCRLLLAWTGCLLVFQLHFQVYGQGSMTLTNLLRSPWPLLPLGAAVLLLVVEWLERRGVLTARQLGRIGLALPVLLVAGGVLAVELLGRGGSGLLWEAREMLHGNWNDRFASSRVFIWKRSLAAFWRHPWLGTGPDTFYQALGPWQSEAFAVTGIYFDKAHNEYLQILVCQGGIGLASMLGFLAAWITGAVQGLRRRTAELLPWAGAAAAYLGQAFFNLSVPITAPLLWVMLGCCAAILGQQEDEAGELDAQ